MSKVVAEGGVDGLGIVLGFELRFVDANQLLSPPRFFTENVVADAIEPGAEFRFAAKSADVFVSAEECFLGEIVGEGDIGADQLTKHTADRGLVAAHEFGKGVVVVIDKNSGDEVCIGERHVRALRQRRNAVFPAFQLPNEQVTGADHERNHTDGPFAAGEASVDRGEKDD